MRDFYSLFRVAVLIFIVSMPISAMSQTDSDLATKNDIKIILEQMDKRFEQVDKRFEQMDKRLDFMQSLIYVLMGLVFASPFIAIYLRDKKESEDRKVVDSIKAIMFVLREMAQNDERLSKSLKAAGLL